MNCTLFKKQHNKWSIRVYFKNPKAEVMVEWTTGHLLNRSKNTKSSKNKLSPTIQDPSNQQKSVQTKIQNRETKEEQEHTGEAQKENNGPGGTDADSDLTLMPSNTGTNHTKSGQDNETQVKLIGVEQIIKSGGKRNKGAKWSNTGRPRKNSFSVKQEMLNKKPKTMTWKTTT